MAKLQKMLKDIESMNLKDKSQSRKLSSVIKEIRAQAEQAAKRPPALKTKPKKKKKAKIRKKSKRRKKRSLVDSPKSNIPPEELNMKVNRIS